MPQAFIVEKVLPNDGGPVFFPDIILNASRRDFNTKLAKYNELLMHAL